MGRSPGDGDGVVMLYLVENGVCAAGNYALVRHWSDRAGGEELDAVVAVRDEIVAGRDSRIE